MTTLSQILENKIVAIIRGANPDDVLKIINALFEGGIMVLEITLNSPKALAVIEEATTKVGNKMLVGAGTVMDAESVKLISPPVLFTSIPVIEYNLVES